MTLLVRDEADILDAQIAFHLHAGVDFVVATDNGSRDETAEILARYAESGVLHVIREPSDELRQAEWVTRMARLASTEFEADWVINSDADEFWWPRAGSLKDVLATVPARFGVVRGCWRHFLPRPDDDGFFAERMIVRLGTPAFPGDKTTIFHAHQKVAHRAHPLVEVETGNHNAEAPGLEPIRAWHPLEVLHFSFRSVAQMERKARAAWMTSQAYQPSLHQILLDDAFHEGRLQEYYDLFAVGDEALERGLADGTLAIDTRLRDALRSLRAGDGGFAPPGKGRRLTFSRPGVHEDALYAAEASVLVGIDGIVRAEARVEALEDRLARLERRSLGIAGEGRGTLRRLARR